MKKTLLVVGIAILSQISFGQINTALPTTGLRSNSINLLSDLGLFLPLETLEKNNSYDGPLNITESTIIAGIATLKYSYDLTYSPAGVLVSITAKNSSLTPMDRQIYGRDYNNKIVFILKQVYIGGYWQLSSRIKLDYSHDGKTTKIYVEDYNNGTNEWEFDEEVIFEYVGGYDYPSEIIVHNSDPEYPVGVQRFKYQYDSNNKPTVFDFQVWDKDFLTWVSVERWDIAEWGPTEFKSDFYVNLYSPAPTAIMTDFIIGKINNNELLPSHFTSRSGFDILTQTYSNNVLFNNSIYNSDNKRTEMYISIINSTDTIPEARYEFVYDPCYGFKKLLQYEYDLGTYKLKSGEDYVAEITPYLSSCFVTAYNYFGDFSATNPSGTWKKRYEMTQVSNLGIEEAELELFKAYPNPASSKITIESISSKEAQLTIVDLMGKTIQTEKLSGYSTTLNIEQLPEGVYIMQYITNGLKQTTRFIKQ